MKKVNTVPYAASANKAGQPFAPPGPQPHDLRGTPARTPAKPAATEASTRVIKTLRPGQAGTQRWQDRYGDRLLCVRHREDQQATQRIVTLELIVESRPIRARVHASTNRRTARDEADPRRHPVRVRIDSHEDNLRRKAYAAGAICDPHQPVWTMPLATARALRVLRRIIHE